MNILNNVNLKAGMGKTILFLVVLGFFCLPTSVPAVESMISKIRVKKIARIIKEYTSANLELTDPDVQKDILDRVAKEFSLEPDEKPNVTPVAEIAREVRKLVLKRFPDSIKKIRAKAQKEADQKFKMKEKLDFVTVKVQRGRSSYSVSGVFYGFGVGGKSVRIGDNLPIALFDLAPEDRAKFDAAFCKEAKKKYVAKKIRKYFDRKQAYLNVLFRDRLEKVARENEKLGYIYRWGKWRTPKDVTEYLIKQQIRQLRLHPQKNKEGGDGDEGKEGGETVEVAAKPGSDNPDDNGASGAPDAGVSAGKGEPKTDIRLAKLKAEVEKKRMEIAGSQFGVDADQMFKYGDKLVLIGLPREDVNLLLEGLVPSNSTGDVEKITFNDGPISEVSLYFINNIFYKVSVDYRIGPVEAMKELLAHFKEAYGTSIEEEEMARKEKERQARLAKIKKLCKKGKHKWTKGGVCKICHVRKADLEPPKLRQEQTLTWKGDIITAQLRLKFTPKFDNFESFVLTKENVNLRIEQERILKDEERRRAEEQKKKEIEAYKKIK